MWKAKILLFILALFWTAMPIVLSINLDTIRKIDGENALFTIMIIIITACAYSAFVYWSDMVEYEMTGTTVFSTMNYSNHILQVLSILVFVMAFWSGWNFYTKYDKDPRIPEWKKEVFKISTIIIGALAFFTLGHRTWRRYRISKAQKPKTVTYHGQPNTNQPRAEESDSDTETEFQDVEDVDSDEPKLRIPPRRSIKQTSSK